MALLPGLPVNEAALSFRRQAGRATVKLPTDCRRNADGTPVAERGGRRRQPATPTGSPADAFLNDLAPFHDDGRAAASLLPYSLSNPARAQGNVIIGIVYVGPKDDFGWNQAHAVSVGALKSTAGVKIVEEENVPETAAVLKSMESMINLEGANLILATSFGYFNPFMVDAAKKYPKVAFRHASPLWEKGKHRTMREAISAISIRPIT